MKSKALFTCLIMSMVLSVIACDLKFTVGKDKSDDKKDNVGGQKPNRVNWESIPEKYNPTIDEDEFDYNPIETKYIDLNQSGFTDDVEVVYSSALSPGRAKLKIYEVWYDSAQWPALYLRQSRETFEIKSSGTYSCSIEIKNNQISSLKGGCYLRIQLVLPEGAQIEVSNVGELISKRFFAMSNEKFLERMARASFDSDRHAVIQEFLTSYTELGKAPQLTSAELGSALHRFAFGEEKLNALGSLHAYVSDRQNLGAMIDREFTHFDRQKARAIVGI